MAKRRRWIFESRAPLEEFERHFEDVLTSDGFDVRDAKVFDIRARGDGFRVFVAFQYHRRGIEAHVKVKGGLLSDPDAMFDRVFEALRSTQLELADRGSKRDEGGGKPDDDPSQAGAGDVTRLHGDDAEQDGDEDERDHEQGPRQDL